MDKEKEEYIGKEEEIMDEETERRCKEDIDRLTKENELDLAMDYLRRLMISITSAGKNQSVLYYLEGNIHRKRGEFDAAIRHYTLAVKKDPDSPAAEALKALQEIMNFSNKDMYNH